MEGDTDWIAQARCEGGLPAAVGVEALDGRSGRVLRVGVAGAADCDVEGLAVRSEGDVPRPVSATAAERAVSADRFRIAAGPEVSGFVRNPDDPTGLSDVEISVVNGETVGTDEAAKERLFQVRAAVAVAVAQKRDSARPRFGEKHVAVVGDGHPAGVVEIAREEIDPESPWHVEGSLIGLGRSPGAVGDAGCGVRSRHVLRLQVEAQPRNVDTRPAARLRLGQGIRRYRHRDRNHRQRQ